MLLKLYNAAPPRPMSVRVLVREDAVALGGRHVVVIVHPRVRAVLDALLDGQRLVIGTRLVAAWVGVVHRRPQHRGPLDRGHDDVEAVELGAAARLGRREDMKNV